MDIVRDKKILAIVVGFLIVILAVVAFYIYSVVDKSGKIEVSMNTVPRDSIVTIDGDSVAPNGSIYLEPGVYTLAAEKEGFKKFTREITVSETEHTVVTLLEPVSAEAIAWAKNNSAAYIEMEGIAGTVSNEYGEAFYEQNPIAERLPFYTIVGSIGYRSDTSDETGKAIIIEAESDPGYEQALIEKIYEWGYDPTDLNIKFSEHESPFSL